ncbi:MAG TPA: glutamine amidotransferase [Gammaproteobacteria bacterium]|nr:glutamine amidotransferase [Gammaproteobacteria bacterium]
MKKRTAAVIRHIAFENSGSFSPTLVDAGFELIHLDASLGRIDVKAAVEADLLLVLGGPIGVNDQNDFPVLRQELDAIAQRLHDTRPTMGICLGGQLVAHALGADVTPGDAEIGWSPLTLTAAGRESPMQHLDTPVLHWHNDRFALPANATRLASTSPTANQAFAWQNTLAMQFHPEVTAASLEPWYIGHHRSVRHNGLKLDALRADSERHSDDLAARGRRMLEAWLQSVNLIGRS